MDLIRTPRQLMDFIGDSLTAHFEAHKYNGASYKTDKPSDTFEAAPPYVYKYLCPPDSIVSGFPQIVPSVTVVINSIEPQTDGLNIELSFHTAVTNPSTSESETATPEGDGTFSINESEGYTNVNAQRDLYQMAFDLTFQTLQALLAIKYKGGQISDIKMTPPAPQLESFPYCTGLVTCTATLAQFSEIHKYDIAKLL